MAAPVNVTTVPVVGFEGLKLNDVESPTEPMVPNMSDMREACAAFPSFGRFQLFSIV